LHKYKRKKITVEQFTILRDVLEQMFQKIKEYEKQQNNRDLVIKNASDCESDDTIEDDSRETKNLKNFIEEMHNDEPNLRFVQTSFEEYFQKKQGVQYNVPNTDAIPIIDLRDASRLVFGVFERGELNLVELNSNNLGEIVGPLEEDKNGCYKFMNKRWKLK